MSNVSEKSRKVALKQSIIEISNAWLQAESHNLHAKECIALISEEYEMDKALVNKIAKMYHKYGKVISPMGKCKLAHVKPIEPCSRVYNFILC